MAMSMPSSSFSSTSNSRTFLVEINSAYLYKSKHREANTYVKLWTDPHNKLRTKPSSAAQWSDKFVFAVPCELIKNEVFDMKFELYAERKHLPDHLIGSGRCNLVPVLEEDNEPIIKELVEDYKVACYDTDEEDSDEVHSLEDGRWSDPFEDERQKQRQMEKEREAEEEEAEKQRKAEEKENITIHLSSSGDGRVGVLKTKMEWEGFKCIGKAKLWGMRYEEFMGRKGDEILEIKRRRHPVSTAAEKNSKQSWLTLLFFRQQGGVRL